MLLLAIILGLWNLWQLNWLSRQLKRVEKPGTALPAGNQRISVIMAAHNELDNLKRHLKTWLTQHYPHKTYLLVLDRCTDGSEAYIRTHHSEVSALDIALIHETPIGWQPKKWAIETGLRNTNHDWLVLTDADCSMGPEWLSAHAGAMSGETELILGLGAYHRRPGLLNLIVRFETWFTALQYAGAAAGGKPYMGVGRNLSYKRSFYTRAGGMEAIRTHLSGDDDLLINGHADPARTRVLLDPDSWTWSEPPGTWADWWRQKTRHVSAAHQYTWESRLWLASLHFSQMGFWITAILALILLEQPIWGLGIILARGMCIPMILSTARRLLPGQLPATALPALDFLVFIYNLSVVPYGLTQKPTWRRRPQKSQKTPRKTGHS